MRHLTLCQAQQVFCPSDGSNASYTLTGSDSGSDLQSSAQLGALYSLFSAGIVGYAPDVMEPNTVMNNVQDTFNEYGAMYEAFLCFSNLFGGSLINCLLP